MKPSSSRGKVTKSVKSFDKAGKKKPSPPRDNRTENAKKTRPSREKTTAPNETIQWFPGHMARTRRLITEYLPQVDAVLEIVDARIPVSSRNPELNGLTKGKPRLIVLNKADLADDATTARWLAYYRQQGFSALAVDSKTGRGFRDWMPLLKDLLKESLEKWEAKGVRHTVRAMIVGIPNVGKSSFINRLNKGGKAKVEDRPGVTRQNQWFVAEGAQLLDTPGVLWPKFEDHTVALHLAFTGAIKDQILDLEELACELLRILSQSYRPLLMSRYKLSDDLSDDVWNDPWELLQEIARVRGMLVSGGQVNTERASIMLLDEYRGGKLGRISLEMPPVSKE